jgi:hypothetical protein
MFDGFHGSQDDPFRWTYSVPRVIFSYLELISGPITEKSFILVVNEIAGVSQQKDARMSSPFCVLVGDRHLAIYTGYG